MTWKRLIPGTNPALPSAIRGAGPFLLALLAFGAAATASQAGTLRVAIVDMKTLFKQYPGTTRAQKKLDAVTRQKKQLLSESEKVLSDLQAEMKKHLSLEKKNIKRKEFADEMQDYQDEKGRIEDELAEQDKEMTQKLMGQIKAVVAGVAQKEGFDLVLESDQVANPGSVTDLTREVLEKFAKLNPAPADTDSNP